MLRKFFQLLILLIIFTTVQTYSQGLRVGIGGGITSILSPDGYTNEINDGGANFGTEYHLGLKGKLDIPLIPFTPIGYVTYHSLSGSQSTLTGEIETSQTIWAVGVGGELAIMPGPINPYLAADLSLNNFTDFEREAPALAGGNVKSSGGTRIGLGIGVGLEVSLIVIAVDVSAKYHLLNLIGKDAGEETIGALVLNATLFL